MAQELDSKKVETNINTLYFSFAQYFDFEEKNAATQSPLTLAFIGDAVYELIIRSKVISENEKSVNGLNKLSSNLAKAPTQAAMMKYLLENELVSEEEQAIFRRGRNAKSHTSAKNASIGEYRIATGFEALIGYLYMDGKLERAMEIIKLGFDNIL